MSDQTKKGKGGSRSEKSAQGQGGGAKEEKATSQEVAPPSEEQAVQAPEEAKGKKEKQPKRERSGNRPLEQGRGIVKGVSSGDTLLILVPERNGPPIEKHITLSGIIAPRLGRISKNSSTKDEPYAWQSKEFLRKRMLGKPVSYAIENPTQNGGYGVVFDGNESLAKIIVAAGYAKVKRPSGEFARPDIEELIQLEEAASREGKGVFSKEEFVRDVIQVKDNLITELAAKWKGKPQSALIEQVRSGHSLRALIRDDHDHDKFYDISLFLTGIKTPDIDQFGEYEQFSREAKFFVEHLILNREVSVVFEGVDKRSFYGTVSVEGRVINEEILKNGLGELIDWPKPAMLQRFKAAEKEAQDKRLRIWKNFNDKRTEQDKQGKGSREIVGIVREVKNAGLLIISDQTHTDVKINLSSIRVPPGKFFEKEEAPKGVAKGEGKEEEVKEGASKKEPKAQESKEKKKEEKNRYWAWEGREFLRKRAIGQKVRCVYDYSRPALGQEKEKHFYSVYIDRNNLAVELAEGGFVEAAEHRGGEPRSKDYDQILLAETVAKKAFKGLFSLNTPVLNLADLTRDPVKAKNMFPLLQRAGRLRGIIDYEQSCTKYKIYVPKETCLISLSLSGVRGPSREEPFSKESLALAKELCRQRDVEFDITMRDRGGNFVGNAWILVNGKKKNLAALFLEEGYAYLIPGAVRDNENATELIIAEDSAKKAKKNIWQNYDPEAEEAERQKRREQNSEKQQAKTELIDVMVSEIVDASKFYVQVIGSEQQKLEELMKSLTLQELTEPYTPKKGELVIAKFSEDDAWYRAKVVKVTNNDEIDVFYVDYGNSETIPNTRIRQLPADFDKLPFQAREARLAYVKTPSYDQEFGHEAASFLKEMVWSKHMLANVEYRSEGDQHQEVLNLSLGDRESQVHVNAALLRAGLARVERVRGKHLQQLIAKLKEEEQKARVAHLYLWQYGDPGSDEEEERGPQPPPSAAKPKPQAQQPKKAESKPAESKPAEKGKKK